MNTFTFRNKSGKTITAREIPRKVTMEEGALSALLGHKNIHFLGEVQFADDPKSVLTFEDTMTGELYQMSVSGYAMRKRVAPTEAKPFPEYGDWSRLIGLAQ